MAILVVVSLTKIVLNLEFDRLVQLFHGHVVHLLLVKLSVDMCVSVQLLRVKQHLEDDRKLGKLRDIDIEDVFPRLAIHPAYMALYGLYLVQGFTNQISCLVLRSSDEDLLIGVLQIHVGDDASQDLCFASPRRSLDQSHSFSASICYRLLLTLIVAAHTQQIKVYPELVSLVKRALMCSLPDRFLKKPRSLFVDMLIELDVLFK